MAETETKGKRITGASSKSDDVDVIGKTILPPLFYCQQHTSVYIYIYTLYIYIYIYIYIVYIS